MVWVSFHSNNFLLDTKISQTEASILNHDKIKYVNNCCHNLFFNCFTLLRRPGIDPGL